MEYFYLDIETVPNDKEAYLSEKEEGRKKLLNPIDSHILAIGIKKGGVESQILYSGEDERSILQGFWSTLAMSKGTPFRMVGFNIKEFDLPFLVTRSFLKGVKIHPFILKDVVDVREQLSAFKYGPTRGKLKEYAELLGMPTLEEMDGSMVAEKYWGGEHQLIQEYLKKDLELTEFLHKRMIDLRISEIARW
jgi:predicted PolB exonuclease-like 3'-5' exonuclease